MVTQSAAPTAHRSMQPTEASAVELGYATPINQVRPPKRMLAAVVALIVGLLLLLLASFILLRLVSLLMIGGMGGSDREIFLGLASLFGGFCTVIGAIFLFVGLKWLGGIVRAGG